jgi:hypothetical protein
MPVSYQFYPKCAYYLLCMLGLFLALHPTIAIVAQATPTSTSCRYSGEIIAWLQPQADVNKLLRDLPIGDITIKRCLSQHLNIWLLGFDPAIVAESAMLDRVRRLPAVSLAQFNRQLEPRSTYPNEFNGGLGPANWQLERAHAPEAWDITTGGITTTGEQLVIAVVDLLFDPNDADFDLWQNMDEIPNNAIDDDNNGFVDDYDGWSFQNNSDNIPDDPGHGYAMIRTAAAKGNNNMDISGVGWNIKALQLDIDYSEAQAIAAYAYCHQTRADYNNFNGTKGAFLVSVNSSFGPVGTESEYPVWCAMYDTLGSVGILCPGAVTNSPWQVDIQHDMPADCSSDYTIITHSEMEDYSQHGGVSPTRVDIASPSSTTSESAAFMTGSVALLWSAACPAMIQAYKDNPASMALAMKNIIISTADQSGVFWNKNVANGRINLFSAAQAVVNSSYCTSIALDAAVGSLVTPMPNVSVCVSQIAPQFTLANYGTDNLTNATISYQLNDAPAQSIAWTGNLAYYESTIVTLPTLDIQTGSNTLIITIINPNGGGDSNTANNAQTFQFDVVPPAFGPLTETFSLGMFPANGWSLQNPDGGQTWERVPWIGGYGDYTGTAYMNNFDYNAAGQIDYLVSPFFGVNPDATAARIVFDVAYAPYQNYTDSLAVSLSTDCGTTWERIYYKGGANLATNIDPIGEFEKFVPDANEWRTDTIWISNYIGEQNVQMRFENINQWGNSMYVDNVRFAAFCPISMNGTALVCPNGDYTYSVTPVEGATYNWAIVGNGTILSGQGTPEITVRWNEAGAGEVRIERSTP